MYKINLINEIKPQYATMLVIKLIHASIHFAFKEISHALIMLRARGLINRTEKKKSFALFWKEGNMVGFNRILNLWIYFKLIIVFF